MAGQCGAVPAEPCTSDHAPADGLPPWPGCVKTRGRHCTWVFAPLHLALPLPLLPPANDLPPARWQPRCWNIVLPGLTSGTHHRVGGPVVGRSPFAPGNLAPLAGARRQREHRHVQLRSSEGRAEQASVAQWQQDGACARAAAQLGSMDPPSCVAGQPAQHAQQCTPHGQHSMARLCLGRPQPVRTSWPPAQAKVASGASRVGRASDMIQPQPSPPAGSLLGCHRRWSAPSPQP